MPTDLAGSASSTIAEILAKLGTDPKTGLNPAELQERLNKYGANALAEEKKSALSVIVAYFWGPIPWMIEAAALMALIVKDWGDFHDHRLAPVVQRITWILGGTRSFQRAKIEATFGVLVLPILKGKCGVPAVLGMVAAVSVLGLVVTLVFGREDLE
jgi:magnesium-transporting ATPase (P-type)